MIQRGFSGTWDKFLVECGYVAAPCNTILKKGYYPELIT